ncbi:mCG140439, isoform CRA_a [Mus musculus]|nr:mCG140439, isoform CRA_a [Mus musculus]EDL28620.1 mCG140439, isoform CRA_a [Mus musculus]
MTFSLREILKMNLPTFHTPASFKPPTQEICLCLLRAGIKEITSLPLEPTSSGFCLY